MSNGDRGTNRTLSLLFGSMADLLAMQQANPYRVRAYRRASESLSKLDEPVETVSGRGGLRDIPGIGKELASKIAQFSPAALPRSKQAIWESLDRGLDDALDYTWDLIQAHNDHPDPKEGATAFMEKRKPRWAPLSE